ncbi:MAG: hypothetical protein ABFD79_04690 [Phycisphaerales bacterium]
MKALYRHKTSGDLFAIETDGEGKILNTSGPLLSRDLDPAQLDYDNYFNDEIRIKQKDFILLTKEDYLEILRKNGFYSQKIQKHLFG